MSVEGNKRIARVVEIDRDQFVMRPMDVDKLIDESHPARAIWEFVGRQDLDLFYKDIKAVEGVAGRECWDPRMMITIWVYAYSEGISSAREISRLLEYHPAFQWISGLNIVNHHSLSDFRIGYGEALTKLFTEVLGAMSSEGLITMNRITQDGTKVEASASSSSFRREGTIREHLKLAEEQVKAMEQSADQEVSKRVEKARRRAAREKKERLEKALKELEKVRAVKSGLKEKEDARVSMTDPESRVMKQANGGFEPSYNVQISTDSEQKLIVAMMISKSGTDVGELAAGIDKVEENTGSLPGQVVVDGAYVSASNIVMMEEKKIEMIGPIPDNEAKTAGLKSSSKLSQEFLATAFIFHAETNTFICPAGSTLRYSGKQISGPNICYTYRASFTDCQPCPFKEKCCPSNKASGRAVTRKEQLPEITRFLEKMQTEEAKEIYKHRSEVAEFPNLWIKEKFKLRRFRLRGVPKVQIEGLWACLAYNLKQWIRLSGRPVPSTTG